MPATFTTELGNNIAKFHFLCSVPGLEPAPQNDDECTICQEPYQDNTWEYAGTLHRPFKLPCGHVFGFQCLARWILSASFVDHCPLCRKHIVKPAARTRRYQLRRLTATSLARLESIAVVAGNGVSRSQKMELLRVLRDDVWIEKDFWYLPDEGDRIMVASEEFLNVMCPPSSAEAAAPAAPAHARPVNTRAVAQRPRGNTQFHPVLPKWAVQVVFFFSFVGLAYVSTGHFWDHYTGRSDTFTAWFLSLTTFLTCSISLITLLTLGLPVHSLNVVFGIIVGGILGMMVRRIDELIFESWMVGSSLVESRTRLW